jgi:hypothetical protein
MPAGFFPVTIVKSKMMLWRVLQATEVSTSWMLMIAMIKYVLVQHEFLSLEVSITDGQTLD